MLDEITAVGRCEPGDCDHHSEHPPCYRGWLSADRVCPCWAARRAADVHHTGPVVAGGTAMPGSVRAAWNTARRTSNAEPGLTPPWSPKPRPNLQDAPKAEPEADDEQALQILQGLHSVTEVPAGALNRLKATMTAALNNGWPPAVLAEHLDRNRGPDPSPIRYWIWTLNRIGAFPQPESATGQLHQEEP